jgi:hypothetical protein
MNFYTKQHKYYYGIDLHAGKMYVCILDQRGKVRPWSRIIHEGYPWGQNKK